MDWESDAGKAGGGWAAQSNAHYDHEVCWEVHFIPASVKKNVLFFENKNVIEIYFIRYIECDEKINTPIF
jgi:hypothetical protein